MQVASEEQSSLQPLVKENTESDSTVRDQTPQNAVDYAAVGESSKQPHGRAGLKDMMKPLATLLMTFNPMVVVDRSGPGVRTPARSRRSARASLASMSQDETPEPKVDATDSNTSSAEDGMTRLGSKEYYEGMFKTPIKQQPKSPDILKQNLQFALYSSLFIVAGVIAFLASNGMLEL